MQLDAFVLRIVIVAAVLVVFVYGALLVAGVVTLMPWGILLLVPMGIAAYVIARVVAERVQEAREDPYDNVDN
ncbi:MAG: hypothetical protein AAFQ33_08470 [Pseudomonadota bacterium]